MNNACNWSSHLGAKCEVDNLKQIQKLDLIWSNKNRIKECSRKKLVKCENFGRNDEEKPSDIRQTKHTKKKYIKMKYIHTQNGENPKVKVGWCAFVHRMFYSLFTLIFLLPFISPAFIWNVLFSIAGWPRGNLYMLFSCLSGCYFTIFTTSISGFSQLTHFLFPHTIFVFFIS